MASVEIQTPDGVVQVRLDRDHLTIGRLANNAIALPYAHISRQHAELRKMGQTWWIVDMRSTNGLHVGGQRVRECQLTPETFVMLSPLVTLRLIEERSSAFVPPGTQAPYYAPGYGAPAQIPVAPSAPSMPSMPSVPFNSPSIAPAAGPMSMSDPIQPLSALGPRSPYSDDEAPFYPQMRQPSGPYYQRPPTLPGFTGSQGGRMPPPIAAHPAAAPAHASRFEQPGPAPVAATPPAGGEQRRTSFMAPSPLLHVCQTCGQRTTPDAVYCQNCHHSIATECTRCRLSLLPIQDLCPRCQTPNPASVRRARAAGAW